MTVPPSSSEYLKVLRSELEELVGTVEERLAPLDNDALLRRPAPDSWSVAECLAHLIATKGGCNRSKGFKDPAQWMPPNRTY